MSLNGPSQHQQTVIRVYLVNGDARSISFNERNDVTDLIRYMLHKIRMNLEVSLQLFGLMLKHTHSNEAYWLQPGVVVQEQLNEYCATKPLEEWKFLLRIRVLPKTPQHLLSQDPVAFQYFYDQVFHMYLEDESIVVDNETGVKLGCLELRRFYKDMPQIALKRKENFTMLEREIGLEKFFKKSMIAALRKKNLRTMVLSAFQQYESLTMEGCIFQFFNLLSKHTHSLDTERFSNCAIGDDQAAPLTYEIFVGPNSDIEFKPEGGNQKFLAAFNDIQDILCEPELMSRGRVILQTKNCLAPIIIRTALLVTAVDLATLIDGYCMVYTQSPHSRMAMGKKRYSNSSRFSGLYSIADDDRFRSGVIDPYLVFKRNSDFTV